MRIIAGEIRHFIFLQKRFYKIWTFDFFLRVNLWEKNWTEKQFTLGFVPLRFIFREQFRTVLIILSFLRPKFSWVSCDWVSSLWSPLPCFFQLLGISSWGFNYGLGFSFYFSLYLNEIKALKKKVEKLLASYPK